MKTNFSGVVGLRSIHSALVFLALLAGCTVAQTSAERQTGRFEFGLIGDIPYTAEDERKFPNLIQDMNEADLAFVIHNGDFWWDGAGWNEKVGGLPPCSDAAFQDRIRLAQSFKHPFILAPGDNEWTDCHRAKPRTFDPLERLAKVREMFFREDQSLGQRTIRLTSQSEDPNPKYHKFRENLRWTYGGVLFVTVHIVGSNNNLGRTPEMDAEYAERNAANLVWLRQAFELAKRDSNRGIMIVTQANPLIETRWPASRLPRVLGRIPVKPPDKKRTGYDDFLQLLEAEVVVFDKPVVLVHGDTHVFHIDKPLLSSKGGQVIENFTRVETFGTPDIHWVRVIVEPNDGNVFTFRPEIVKKNLLNHAIK